MKRVNRYLYSMVIILSSVMLLGATTMVDPTRPPSFQDDLGDVATTDQNITTPTLSAIFFRNGNSSAIINGKLMHVNEKIGTYTITSITHDSVQLIDSNKEIVTLKLIGSVVKSPR